MSKNSMFRIASIGILITSLVLVDYTNLTLESNYNKFIMLFLSIILWFMPLFLSPIKDLKKTIAYLNFLIIFLIIFALINLILIIISPTSIKSYGWIFISICFIISYVLIKKTNKEKLQSQINH